MSSRMKIDFVSDVSCPWCAVGLKALEAALARMGPDVTADLHFQPFELNPQMAPEGEEIVAHITRKYGPAADIGRSQQALQARAQALGFHFDFQRRSRIYNTFDAHRLLHWAGTQGRQHALKNALFAAYFTQGLDPSNHAVLVKVAARAGLDEQRTRQILESDEFAREVREREQYYAGLGIQAVPSVIVNDRHLIQGGQPTEVFEQALRQIAASTAAPT